MASGPLGQAARHDGWASFVVFESVFSELDCEELVRLGEATLALHGAEEGAIEGLDTSGGLRDSRVGWIPREAAHEWAFDRLEEVATAANERWRLEVSAIEEELQYTLYDRPGAHYTWHHDGLEAGVEDRKLSLVVQLSDPGDYAGADLEFLEVAEDYTREERRDFSRRSRTRGTVVAFCAFEYHRVTPLLSGLRRSLVAWVSGPPLR
jgi:PKHD-type hydroxylase